MNRIEVTIKSDGQEMKSPWAALSVDIIREVNRIPRAQITVFGGSLKAEELTFWDKPFFKIGGKVEISAKDDEKAPTKLFEGLVVKQGVNVDDNKSFIIVDLKDPAFKLTRGRKSAVYEKKKDSDIIKAIIGNCSGVDPDKIADTSLKHKSIVQYYSTDWDFIVSRADVNGQWVLVKDGKLSTAEPKIEGPKKPTVDRQKTWLHSLHIEVDGQDQYKEVKSAFWDAGEQKLDDSSKAKPFKLEQGDDKPDDIAKKLGGDKCNLIHGGMIEKAEAKAWANSKMIKSRLSMLRGVIKAQGEEYGKIYPGDTIEIKDFGKSYSGKTIVTGIRHQISPASWTVDVQFGVSSNWFYQNDHVIDAPSAGLLPGVHGLQIGIVDDFKEDDEGHFRVKVKVPSIDSSDNVIWARQALPEATKKAGFFFRPHTKDEVVLGFINDDPRQAVILGAVYNKKNELPEEFKPKLDKKNEFRGLETIGGSVVIFDDKDKQIEIRTKNKNKILLSDKKKGITLEDENKNTIVTDDKGITIEDKNGNKIVLDDKGISMETGKDIKVKSGGDTKIKAGGKVDIKGSTIKANAAEIKP